MLEGNVTAGRTLQGKINPLDVIYTDAYEIAVKNGFEGTVDEWLASIKGEKGDKGDKGDTGAQGKQGVQGEPGKSAYDVAVDNGFDGQEQDWLESLKGTPGKDGSSIHGITGKDFDSFAVDGKLVVGDLYFVLSDYLEGELIKSYKGTLWEATETNRAEPKGWIRDGEPGKDGQDYVLTEADKEDITQSVLAALPVYNGEVL